MAAESEAQAVAAFVVSTSYRNVDDFVRDQLRLHFFDILAAAAGGANVPDAIALRQMAPALALTATVRCSELDDIHLASGITPGSAIVPAVLAVASTIEGLSEERLFEAILVGYEVLIRFGLAVDGARLARRGVWVTLLCSGFGVAAAISKLLGLRADQTANALSIVASLAAGTTGARNAGYSPRWFLLGAMVQNAVCAAFAARNGTGADNALIGKKWSDVTGIPFERDRLLDGLGERYVLPDVSFKPICCAKQTAAAIDAFRLLESDGLEPADVAEIVVEVPTAYAAMIDLALPPASRLDTITSIRFQLALAAYEPDRQLDVVRSDISLGDEQLALSGKISVRADASLDVLYPELWPARVTAVDTAGRRWSREVARAFGDPETGYGWPAAAGKYRRVARASEADCARLVSRLASFGENGAARPLVDDIITVSREQGTLAPNIYTFTLLKAEPD